MLDLMKLVRENQPITLTLGKTTLPHIFFTSVFASLLAFFVLNSTAAAHNACVMPNPPSLPNGQSDDEAVFAAALAILNNDFGAAIDNFTKCLDTKWATPEQMGHRGKLIAEANHFKENFGATVRRAARDHKENKKHKKHKEHKEHNSH